MEADIDMDYWLDGPTDSLPFMGEGPDSAGCPGDLNGDMMVDVNDVLTAIAGFGTDYQVEDLLEVLAYFGQGC